MSSKHRKGQQPMQHNPFDDEPGDQDFPASVVYEGVQYDVEEASRLARWLGDEQAMTLLNRYLDGLRQSSVDMMDAGIVTISSAEELVRQSAMRNLILNIKMMGADLTRQLEAIAQAEANVEENV